MFYSQITETIWHGVSVTENFPKLIRTCSRECYVIVLMLLTGAQESRRAGSRQPAAGRHQFNAYRWPFGFQRSRLVARQNRTDSVRKHVGPRARRAVPSRNARLRIRSASIIQKNSLSIILQGVWQGWLVASLLEKEKLNILLRISHLRLHSVCC